MKHCGLVEDKLITPYVCYYSFPDQKWFVQFPFYSESSNRFFIEDMPISLEVFIKITGAYSKYLKLPANYPKAPEINL